MLKLNNIVKEYPGATTVEALKGVSIAFRPSEFVAILGHSGCGKTTLLNIIGGLDRYTNGDLIIRGSGLHIEKLGLDTGELSVTGTVTEMCYDESAPQGSFWSRLFK